MIAARDGAHFDVVKDQALFRETINVRRLHPVAAIGFAEMTGRIVRDDEEHVGPGGRGRGRPHGEMRSHDQRGKCEEESGSVHGEELI
jgi:hypothetical protein